MEKRFDGYLERAGVRREIWDATVPAGTDPKDVLQPSYWATATGDLEGRDIVDVETEDAAWARRLRVMEVDKTGGRVLMQPIGEVMVFERGHVPAGYDIAYLNRVTGFVVRSKHNDAIMRQGFRTHMGALDWLRSIIGDAVAAKKGAA